MPDLFRSKLIDAGVKHLKESYPSVNRDNILTDAIYRAFFKAMLEVTLDDLVDALVRNVGSRAAVKACKDLIEEITEDHDRASGNG